MSKPVVVRFAPSPTGRTHLGSGRTALYNYLYARQTGGRFILRIEDTDQKRYVPGAEQELIDSLHWLGIQWDEGPDVGGPNGPYYQTQRREIYQQHARWLVEHGHAYACFCTSERLEKVRQEQIKNKQNPRYDGTCRRLDPATAEQRVAAGERHVIRFKIPPEGAITVRDQLRGDIRVENSSLDDMILVKSDGLALYHLAAIVDDHLMGVTHVIRGSEWLSTFPLHGHILQAFGWERPVFIHLSIFLKPSGKGKMSKRDTAEAMKDGHSIFITDLSQLGYLPEAAVNWTALMGWSYDDHTEFFTMNDLLEKFSLEKLNPAPAAINFTKLDHFNGLHIRNLAIEDLARRIRPFLEQAGYRVDDSILLRAVPLIRERLVTLDEAPRWIGFLFQDEVFPASEDLIGSKMTAQDSANAARRALVVLQSLPELTLQTAEPLMRQLAEELGLQAGQLFGILRVAVTGQKVSPPLFESMEIIGKEKVLKRVERAIKLLVDSNR
ncbi:MAG: glutamate--tRNA ligase [Chloroflexi bacterium RBG_16_57_11]|nr:MAG: glutamate--tRNA ligase [Chloroflexi bacterium RBG_16_57_11]